MNVATCVSMKSFTVPKAAQSDSWALKADFSEQVETSAEKQSWHLCTHSTAGNHIPKTEQHFEQKWPVWKDKQGTGWPIYESFGKICPLNI